MSSMVNKVTLSTGRVVILKELEMRDDENATLLAAKKAGDSPLAFSIFMLTELTKILVLEIDGKKLTAQDKLQIDKTLSRQEFQEVRQVVGKLMGDPSTLPTIEAVASGQQ